MAHRNLINERGPGRGNLQGRQVDTFDALAPPVQPSIAVNSSRVTARAHVQDVAEFGNQAELVLRLGVAKPELAGHVRPGSQHFAFVIQSQGVKITRRHLDDALAHESLYQLGRGQSFMSASNTQLSLPRLAASKDVPSFGIEEERMLLACANLANLEFAVGHGWEVNPSRLVDNGGSAKTSLALSVISPGEARFDPLTDDLRANRESMPRTTCDLLHLNMGQRLHQRRHSASLDFCRVPHAELPALIRPHHEQLLGVGDHGCMLSAARHLHDSLLQRKRLRHIVSTEIAIAQAELSIRV